MKTLDGRPPEHKPRNAEIITRSAKWKKSHRSLIRRQKAQAKTLMAALSNVSPQHSIPLLQTIGNNGTSIIHPTITTELPELLPLVYPPTPDNKPTQIKTHIQQHQDKIRAMIRGKMLPFTLEMRLNQAYEDKKRLYLKLQETDNAATKYTIEIEIEGILMRISTYETLLQPIRRIIYYHYKRARKSLAKARRKNVLYPGISRKSTKRRKLKQLYFEQTQRKVYKKAFDDGVVGSKRLVKKITQQTGQEETFQKVFDTPQKGLLCFL